MEDEKKVETKIDPIQELKAELQRLYAAKGELITNIEINQINLRQVNDRLIQVQEKLQGK